MKFKRLNTVLTLTSNVAVLIGIILVIVELRQNDDTLNATIQLSLSQSYEELATLGIENPAFTETILRAYTDPASMTRTDIVNIMAMQYRRQMVLHTTYNLYLEGIVSEAFWREKASHFTIDLLQSPTLKQIYEDGKHDEMFSPEFFAALEAIAEEQKAAREANIP